MSDSLLDYIHKSCEYIHECFKIFEIDFFTTVVILSNYSDVFDYYRGIY